MKEGNGLDPSCVWLKKISILSRGRLLGILRVRGISKPQFETKVLKKQVDRPHNYCISY